MFNLVTIDYMHNVLILHIRCLYNQRTSPSLFGPGFSRVGQSLPERWRTPFGSRCMAATGNVFARCCQQAYQFSFKMFQGLKTYAKDLVLGLISGCIWWQQTSVFNLWESGTNCFVWTQDSAVGAIATTWHIRFCLAVAPLGVSLHELCKLCQWKTIQRRLWVCLLQANSVGCRGRHNSKKQKMESLVASWVSTCIALSGKISSGCGPNKTKISAGKVPPKKKLRDTLEIQLLNFCEYSFGRLRISRQTCEWKILMNLCWIPITPCFISVVYLFLSDSHFGTPVKGLSGPPNGRKIDAWFPSVQSNFCNPRFCVRAGLPQHRIRNPSLEALQWSIWLFKRLSSRLFRGVHPGFIMVLDVTWWSWRSSATQRSILPESQTCGSVICFPEPSRSLSAYTWPSWVLFPPVSPFPSSSMNDHEGSSALLQGHDRHLAIHGMHQDGISNPTTT